MLVRGKRLAPLLGPLLLIAFIVWRFRDDKSLSAFFTGDGSSAYTIGGIVGLAPPENELWKGSGGSGGSSDSKAKSFGGDAPKGELPLDGQRTGGSAMPPKQDEVKAPSKPEEKKPDAPAAAPATPEKKPETPAAESKAAPNTPPAAPAAEKKKKPVNEDLAIGQTDKGRPGLPTDMEHTILYSQSTADKKYFMVSFLDMEAINPNIVPHPQLNDTWVIVAQQQASPLKNSVWFAELVCNAAFKDGKLECTHSPQSLPIAATSGEKCEGNLDYFRLNVGPHDARVFFGPTVPYCMFGSNSKHTCFSEWIQDFRLLHDWGFELFKHDQFRIPTELQRPGNYGMVEKNWFVFWDKDNAPYAHYDVYPSRVFAKLNYDGSVGPDLAPLATTDDKCMAKYMPRVAPTHEGMHQATNSLSVTMCKRADPSCTPTDENTFVLNIFQFKSYYEFHSVYEPYAMLFRRHAPFDIYGISTKPIWIHGRGREGAGKKPSVVAGEWTQTEMFYMTSISWKTQGQKYHGYLDDVMFIGFGIEDTKTAAIDVLAGDLLADIGVC